jgi:hypothetical protein
MFIGGFMFKQRMFAVTMSVVLLASLSGCTTLQMVTEKLIQQATATPSVVPTRTASQLMQDLTPSIVRIVTSESQGTGFVVFTTGQVLRHFTSLVMFELS